ncbi:MAG: hypothetical protein WA840_22480, partial [Caulobacteraceae bacterium]
ALRQAPPDAKIQVGGGEIDVRFADGAPGLDRAPVLAWIRKSAVAVSTYFGRYPVPRVGLLIVAEDDDRIRTGTTFGFDGSAIRVHVGRHAGADAFGKDWILVHEMTHLALPTVPRRSLWVQEGNAVYVEPIARTQAGQLDPHEVWRWSLVGMPKGQPGAGDPGMDHTHAWGRTYWGGAAFWLQADVAIRERTHGRLGLQTALRAINRQSGGNTADWSVDQVMAAGDAATGGTELSDLYARMKDAPVPIDLDALFARLGVSLKDGQAMFDDHAPEAWIRRAITAAPNPPPLP